MKTSSAKGKGRKLQQIVRDTLLESFPILEPDDIRSTSMGVSGVDIQLSPAAKKIIPYGIECKNQESLSIWACMEQAIKNAISIKLKPVLIFKRNRSKIFTVLCFTDFIEMITELHQLRDIKQRYDALNGVENND